ncbi:hypothetical protein BRE01_32510 [Brevibacillus reuszeri]|uniref:Transposase n=1 Tax=Brevibacillus reuszeri TaxID=54915 RepID=A0ABQ0TPW7_9BACL|nr:hypothetical protein BRE01_32510 [Brevibacillus reuszeri]
MKFILSDLVRKQETFLAIRKDHAKTSKNAETACSKYSLQFRKYNES